MSDQLVIDQMGRQVDVPLSAQRIISLVPSQTEFLLDLGLADRVVGRTKFCIHPAEVVKDIAIVGGTKKLNLDRIAELEPDLIIGNREENDEAQITQLSSRHPIWMSDIYTLPDALHMIESLGNLLKVREQADTIANVISCEFESFEKMISGSAVYLIWDKPIMSVGSGTFIHDLMCRLGLTNAITTARYPEINLESLQAISPDYLFLSSEPFPYNEKHTKAYQKLLPSSKVIVVDGEMFSWYGSRLLKSVDYFRDLTSRIEKA